MPRKSNRRELIIDIATTRFLVSNYDVVTVDELCELSSSTKGSFYHFFANKEALAIDVVNHVWHQTQSQMDEVFASDVSPVKKLEAELDRIASSYLRFDGKRYFIGCPVGTLAVSLRGKSQRLTRRLTFALTHMHQYYQDAYAEALKAGQIESKQSASDLADQFQVSVQGMSTLGKAYSNPAKLRDIRKQLRKSIRTAR